MNIYFCGSISGGRQDALTYVELINYLKKFGRVLTDHIAKQDILTEDGNKDPKFVFQRDMNWLAQADVVVAEVSAPSLGVGYEVAAGINLGKKTLCLYKPGQTKRLSFMIKGNPAIAVKEYNTLDEAKKAINEFFE